MSGGMGRFRGDLGRLGGSGWVIVVLGVALAAPAPAGTLTGPILDEGVVAEIVDVALIPASSASRPYVRINMLREVPDGTGRLFVNDLRGPFWVIDGGAPLLYMDFSVLLPNLKTTPGLASGFVSFAFHPDFASNGLFYTAHSENLSGATANLGPALPATIIQQMVVIEWAATIPGANSFVGTSRELMRIDSTEKFHNIGELVFDPTLGPSDPDYGLLYLCAGDYGSATLGQPQQLQRMDSPYGNLMRIDPLGGPFMRGGTTFDYGIPPTNPFANDPDPTVMGEIYALGFRNGHRLAWDTGGQLGPFVSDIGQKNAEEVNLLVAGADYGWAQREGTFSIDALVDLDTVFPLDPDDAMYGFRYPVAQYDHYDGFSVAAIAGGFVYRGSVMGPLKGQLIFGDIPEGRIFYADVQEMLGHEGSVPPTTADIYQLNLERLGVPTTLKEVIADAVGKSSVSRADLRLGLDAQGEIYVTSKVDGWVRKLVPVPEPGAAPGLLAGVLLLRVLARGRIRGSRPLA